MGELTDGLELIGEIMEKKGKKYKKWKKDKNLARDRLISQ